MQPLHPLTDILEKRINCVHTGYSVQLLKKEEISAICNNVHESEGHYTEWNKPDAEDKHYMTSQNEYETVRLIEAESEMLAVTGHDEGAS